MLTKAVQSSNFTEGRDFSWNAIDGELNTHSATKKENRPWLKLTFENYRSVEKVILIQKVNQKKKRQRIDYYN